MKKYLALILFTLFLFPRVAGATDKNTPIPNIDKWTIVTESHVELIVSDRIVAYLGIETEYNNPEDPNEFIRTIGRYIPLSILKNKGSNEHLLSESVQALYVKKEEEDILSERAKNNDTFLYIRWRTIKEPDTRGNMLDGKINIWMMLPSEEWIHDDNEELTLEFLTENIKNGENHNIFTGMEFKMGEASHILRVDRRIIAQLFEEKK